MRGSATQGKSIFGCFFGHDWPQWEQYRQEGTYTLAGRIYPADVRGKSFAYAEDRQCRTCRRCGFKQDEEVKSS